MALNRTQGVSESFSGSGPYTSSGTQSPNANDYIECDLIFQVFGGGTLPTGCVVSGNGDSNWPLVDHYEPVAGIMSVWKFRTMIASPSSGSLTITPSGDASLKLCQVESRMWSGADQGGSQGSGATVQAVRGSGPSANPQVCTYSLAALGDAANNATTAFTASGSLVTPSMTEWTDRSGSDYFYESQGGVPGATSITATAATAFQAQGGIAVEIKAAAAILASRGLPRGIARGLGR